MQWIVILEFGDLYTADQHHDFYFCKQNAEKFCIEWFFFLGSVGWSAGGDDGQGR